MGIERKHNNRIEYHSHDCHDHGSCRHSYDSSLFCFVKPVYKACGQHQGTSNAEIGKLSHKSRAGRLQYQLHQDFHQLHDNACHRPQGKGTHKYRNLADIHAVK